MCPFSRRPAAQTRKLPVKRLGAPRLQSNRPGRSGRASAARGPETAPRSEEVGLLHDAQELLLVDLAVAVAIRLVDHLLELLVRHSLAELLRDPLQVLEGDLPGLVVVEEPEGLQNLVLRIAVQDLV